MTQNPVKRSPDTSLASHIGGIVLRGFFAYLALTPVIISWGVLLIIVFIITMVSFTVAEDAMAAIFGVLSDLTTRFPFLERFALDSPAMSDSGVIEINNGNLTDVIFGFYGWVAMPFVVLGLLLDVFRGPGKPRPLSQKIKFLSVATLVVIAVLFMNFLLGSDIWAGSALAWSLMFTFGPGIVWVISAVSLAVHHSICQCGYRKPKRACLTRCWETTNEQKGHHG
jgi:hypothetical protein